MSLFIYISLDGPSSSDNAFNEAAAASRLAQEKCRERSEIIELAHRKEIKKLNKTISSLCAVAKETEKWDTEGLRLGKKSQETSSGARPHAFPDPISSCYISV